MLAKAAALLLLTLAGAAPDVPVEPSALVATPAPLQPERVLGTWHGHVIDATGVSHAVEVAFRDGIRPDSVFAYFRLGAKPDTTVRRLGQLVGNDLVFGLQGGGQLVLRWLDGRLVGDVVDPAGQLLKGTGSVELARYR
jgi:hypothetical protein